MEGKMVYARIFPMESVWDMFSFSSSEPEVRCALFPECYVIFSLRKNLVVEISKQVFIKKKGHLRVRYIHDDMFECRIHFILFIKLRHGGAEAVLDDSFDGFFGFFENFFQCLHLPRLEVAQDVLLDRRFSLRLFELAAWRNWSNTDTDTDKSFGLQGFDN